MSRIHNPYLKEFNKVVLEGPYSLSIKREALVKKYAWAIPNEKAICVIAEYSPLIEIGSGTGYWAALLKMAKANILAFDLHPPHSNNKNKYCAPWIYTEVLYGGPPKILKYPERTLFLCWPPYGNNMSDNALRLYQGKYFVYVGEEEYGCTGTGVFHRRLNRKWNAIKRVHIPQWSGLHDKLIIYQRVGT